MVDTNREALAERMRGYFSARSFSEVERACPELAKPRARYDPAAVWRGLRAGSGFDEARVVSYLLFPLDLRWLYYEPTAKFLNEALREFGDNVRGNEFLITVPQPRRVSETRPILARTLVDLHVHDRGSVCFPRESSAGALMTAREANLSAPALRALSGAWGMTADAEGARRLVGQMFRCALAILHAPRYQDDHQDALAQDWAHLPVPKDRALFGRLARVGEKIAILLDPMGDAEPVAREILGQDRLRALGVLRRTDGAPVAAEDLAVTVTYYGPARGDWRQRAYREEEATAPAWGPSTGDLHINPEVYLSNVPEAVWRYELGGYPVIKKWLGYRHAGRAAGRPLTLPEARHLRSMVQRLAALLVLHEEMDALYEKTAADAFTAEDLGLRS